MRFEAKQAVLSARMFYLIAYLLYYFTVFYYPNDFSLSIEKNTYIYLTFSIFIHAISVYFFLTAGSNPGFVNLTETPNSIKEKAQMFVRYDDVANEDSMVGYTERNSQLEVTGSGGDIEMQEIRSTNSATLQEQKPQAPRSLEHIAKMEFPQKKFCSPCNQEMPYRSKHCKDCQMCVRKFDHHCFWVGSCVGELNHRKFFAYIFLQTICFFNQFANALSGYSMRSLVSANFDDQNHVASIWAVWVIVISFFIMFTGLLSLYHSYLICSGQTTWEHARRGNISYLKIYPIGVMPFYKGIRKNIYETFFHGGKCKDWELRQIYELKQEQGFNMCENEQWSCC